MTDKIRCEIYIAMNEDGGYAVGTTEDEAAERLIHDEGGYQSRIVKITAAMTPPAITETELDIPDEAGETTKVEATAA